jgi:hypothetical protein
MTKDAPTDDLVACQLKDYEKRIEDLEGALEAAHNIIRQLRDASSGLPKESP